MDLRYVDFLKKQKEAEIMGPSGDAQKKGPQLKRYQFGIRHLLYAMLATSAVLGLPKLKEGINNIQAHREKVRICIQILEEAMRADDQPEMDFCYRVLREQLIEGHITPDEIGLTPEIEAELQSKRATLPTADPWRQMIKDAEKMVDRM